MLTVKTTRVWKIESGVDYTPVALPLKRSEGRRLAHITVALEIQKERS
jgi:hypothetical protein